VEERQHESEILARIRFGIGTSSTLLLVYANCKEVQAIRFQKGTYPDGFRDYGTVAVANPPSGRNPLDGISRQRFVSSALRQLNMPEDKAKLKAGLERAEARLRAADRGDKGVTNLGILGYDEAAVYMGFLIEQTNSTGNGTDRIVTVGGVTVAQALQVSISRYKLTQSAGDLQAMLLEQQSAFAAFAKANP
jgi:hypothetical protein